MTLLFTKIQQFSLAALVPLTIIELGFIQLASAETLRYQTQEELEQECIFIARSVYKQAFSSSMMVKSKAESFCNQGGNPHCLEKAYANYSEDFSSTLTLIAINKAEDACSN